MNDRIQIRVPADDYGREQFFGGNLGFFIQREIMDAAGGIAFKIARQALLVYVKKARNNQINQAVNFRKGDQVSIYFKSVEH